MTDQKKKSKVEIIDGAPPEWGDQFGLILHIPSKKRLNCKICGSVDVQRVGESHWMCSVCRHVWP